MAMARSLRIRSASSARALLLPLLLTIAPTLASSSADAASVGDDNGGEERAQGRKLFSPALPSFLFVLIDDVGWADLSYNGGTAQTPNIDAWVRRSGSVLLQDMHSGGTVCSPTRATVLTGRNHFRDCVDFVYGCSDMTECVPDFEFAPSGTFTVADAVRAAGRTTSTSNKGGRGEVKNDDQGDDDNDGPYGNGGAFFAGKWHLGSFYNDSELLGGLTSSPTTHGFHHFNATVEVAPTATANCQCRSEWLDECDFGHYNGSNHCQPTEGKDCCFNYWWDDPSSAHGVTNLTEPTPADDALYLADAFSRFLAERRKRTSSLSSAPSGKGTVRGKGGGDNGGAASSTKTADGDGPPAPFLAQISFHNCHIPFIGSTSARSSCSRNETCRPPMDGDPPYTSAELDYYACLTQLDTAFGLVLAALEREGYYDNTMVWFASDNGPEMNCPPDGICERAGDRPHRPVEGPGSAGPLRGRKRDIYEGGHRVPGAISWPARIKANQKNLTSWETVYTTDFLPTVLDVLGIDRPAEQAAWALDGRSVLPILGGGKWNETEDGVRSTGIGYYDAHASVVNGWGYRHGRWKYVEGSASCKAAECRRPQLFDLEVDVGERHDLAAEIPGLLREMQRNFTQWHTSVMRSRVRESECRGGSSAGGSGKGGAPLPLPESLRRGRDVGVGGGGGDGVMMKEETE